jgi:hypothetical protein
MDDRPRGREVAGQNSAYRSARWRIPDGGLAAPDGARAGLVLVGSEDVVGRAGRADRSRRGQVTEWDGDLSVGVQALDLVQRLRSLAHGDEAPIGAAAQVLGSISRRRQRGLGEGLQERHDRTETSTSGHPMPDFGDDGARIPRPRPTTGRQPSIGVKGAARHRKVLAGTVDGSLEHGRNSPSARPGPGCVAA